MLALKLIFDITRGKIFKRIHFWVMQENYETFSALVVIYDSALGDKQPSVCPSSRTSEVTMFVYYNVA